MRDLNSDAVLLAIDEKADSYKFYDDSEKLDQRLKVLAISDVQAYPNVKFMANQSLAPGMLFGKHPYLGNTYVDLNIYEDEIFKYTQYNMRRIAFYLGVKKIEFSVKVLECKKSDKNLHIDGNGFKVEADVKIAETEEKKMASQYSKTYEFEGKADEETYAKAKQVAEESGLLNKVDDIKELINFHNPSLPVKEKKRKINMIITKEYNSRLDVAATVSYFNILKVNADYNTKFQCYNEYAYEISLEW